MERTKTGQLMNWLFEQHESFSMLNHPFHSSAGSTVMQELGSTNIRNADQVEHLETFLFSTMIEEHGFVRTSVSLCKVIDIPEKEQS